MQKYQLSPRETVRQSKGSFMAVRLKFWLVRVRWGGYIDGTVVLVYSSLVRYRWLSGYPCIYLFSWVSQCPCHTDRPDEESITSEHWRLSRGCLVVRLFHLLDSSSSGYSRVTRMGGKRNVNPRSSEQLPWLLFLPQTKVCNATFNTNYVVD